MNIDFVYAGNQKVGPVPFGVISLAAILETEGHSVQVVDLDGQSFSYDSLAKRYEREKREPKMIGLTTMTTPTLERVAHLAELYRQIFPQSLIVVGGPHATIFPQEMLQELPIDVVVVGEGYVTVQDLARKIETGADLGEVQGLYYRKNGGITQTGERPLLMEMDILPMPAWHLVDLLQHYYVYIIESRGCPFRCTFCYSQMHKRYITKSPARVVQDIKYMHDRFKVRTFKFWDDLPFGGHKAKMVEFCERLRQERLNVSWSCFIRPEMVDEETIQAMRAAGCFRVALGVETGSPRMLKILNKHNTPEKYRHVFTILNKHDIITGVTFMLGLPDENKEDLEMSLQLAREIKATEYFAQNFKPYPGTALFQFALERGFNPPQNIFEWSKYSDFTQYNVNVSNVSTEDLLKVRKQIEGLTDKRKIYRILARVGLKQVATAPLKETSRFLHVGYNRLIAPRIKGATRISG
ncbi:MAG: B12-binding domain-containing radical SAM protein [Chloroflexi bacterium]|nr:B12-binding domain-containing radical SAM protein [Chloroflexota bacterium]MCL5075275.1 B12-binding domain-containing radical SAM protein [Chloroflexota bacterium]